MQTFDLVVMGSGPAGQRAAVQAAKLGKRVAVVERRRDMGGVCINTGTIPSKTLREAVLDLSGLRQRELYGSAYRGKDEITVQDLFMRTNAVMTRERDVIKAQLQRNGVKLLGGSASFAGPNEVAIEDGDTRQSVGGEHILIAVGTTPGLPAGIEVDHRHVLTSDDVLSMPRLPRQLTVIGAGIIGVEYATIFAALGIEVTLMDKRTELLDMVDRELVDVLTVQARRMNVTLRLGEEVATLEVGSEDRVVVQMKSGKRLATEMVLVSAGRQGMTAGLGLEKAGLSADDRGRIQVNAHFQTTVPHIYAAGDVIGFPALASTSAEQGRLAACHMFGVPAESVPALFPFGIYAIPEVAWVGRNEAELTREGVPFETGVARYEEIARGQILGDPDGMLKLIFHLDTQKILGVWVLGTQATELVHVGQAVMALGGTLEYFIRTVFNYPTLGECYKVAALDGYNKLRDLSRVARTIPAAAPAAAGGTTPAV
ncbi:MAG TPA: Si-specific NAD(P)(+) transhydrogenase [Candidatus Sulfotelmatobacter sp.]|nr:Si-specific NAD(P)(+) transhydrogenase [Candidatus Sulfotelmatobacter sp.]